MVFDMAEIEKKISVDEITIERIKETHNLKGFVSYEQELVKFLVEDALGNQNKQISVTYLWFFKPTKELIGYVTLLNDRINLEGDLKTIFRRKGKEKDSIHFYKKQGFMTLKERQKGTTPMYLDLVNNIKFSF